MKSLPAYLVGHRQGLLILGIFLASAALNLQHLFPYPYETNQNDYPRFLHYGRQIVNGLSEGRPHVPPYNEYPLVDLFYAILYIPVHKSPDWLNLTGWLGRVIIFTGIWVTILLIARSVRLRHLPIAAAATLFVVPVFGPLLGEGPHGLFPCLSGLALWQFLEFYHTGRVRHAWGASLLTVLAAFTHTDGFYLYALLSVLVVAVALTGYRERYARSIAPRLQTAAAIVMPFLVVVGVYAGLLYVAYGNVQGTVRGHTTNAYFYFELSELGETSLPGYLASRKEATRLYGYGEENDFSVLKAIMRNPSAFVARILRTTQTFVPVLVTTYGGPTGMAVLLLAVAGLVYLASRRSLLLGFTFLAWGGFLLIYLPFYFNERVLVFPYYLLVTLAAIGGIWLATVILRGRRWHGNAPVRWVTIAVAGALLIGCKSSQEVSFRAPRLGTTSEERISYFLQETQPRHAVVASYEGMVPYMAKREWGHLRIFSLFEPEWITRETVQQYLQSIQADVVFLNPDLETNMPEVHRVIRDEIARVEILSIREQEPKRLEACELLGVECVYRVVRLSDVRS